MSEFSYPTQAINLHVLSDPYKPGLSCYSLKIVMLVATLHSWQPYRTITWKLLCTFWILLRTIKVFNWAVFFCSHHLHLFDCNNIIIHMESWAPQNIVLQIFQFSSYYYFYLHIILWGPLFRPQYYLFAAKFLFMWLSCINFRFNKSPKTFIILGAEAPCGF